MPVDPITRALLSGARRRRRRVPRQLRPTRIADEYTRALQRYVDAVRSAWAPVLAELPELLRRVRSERRDAGEAARLRTLIAAAEQALAASLNVGAIENLARTFAIRTAVFNRQQLRRQAIAALGVDPFVNDRALAELMDRFVGENVALIKDIPLTVSRQIEQAVTRGVTGGALHKDLAKEIDEKFALGRERSALIARDQVGKFYGQTNAVRQKSIGIRRFVWRTVNDIRVRGTPGGPFAGDHYQRDGQLYSYKEPPNGELPGEPILCRCYADPYFEDIL